MRPVPRIAPPQNLNNQTQNFEQPANGFGLSNFRIQETIPETIMRTSTTQELTAEDQSQLPVGELMYQRHSNFLFREKYGDYRIVDESKKIPDDYVYTDLIKSIIERNPLSDFFFSKRNLDHMQNLIIGMVKQQSNGIHQISRQDDSELLIIMRGIYLQTQSNPFATGEAFKREVCILNRNVLDVVVPKLIVSIQQYLGYIRDQGNQPAMHQQPQFMSSAGTRVNSSITKTFI
jgi:hypothetical protein